MKQRKRNLWIIPLAKKRANFHHLLNGQEQDLYLINCLHVQNFEKQDTVKKVDVVRQSA